MNKSIICLTLVILGMFSRGDTITNTVVIVSNYYNNVYHESIVTQKVKNTHIEYYFTNNVYTVSNRTLVVSQTNLNVNVINTNFGPWIAKCENAANNAQGSAEAASSSAFSASSSASAASSSASSASASAGRAAASASSASSAADDGLRRINERIQWFDDHAGQNITNINITTNIYNTVDETARQAATNRFVSFTYGSLTVDTFKVSVSASPFQILGGSGLRYSKKVGINGYYFDFTFFLVVDKILIVDGKHRIYLKPANRYERTDPGYLSATADITECYWENGYWHVTEYVQTYFPPYMGGGVENWHNAQYRFSDPGLSPSLNATPTLISYTHSGTGSFTIQTRNLINVSADPSIKPFDSFATAKQVEYYISSATNDLMTMIREMLNNL